MKKQVINKFLCPLALIMVSGTYLMSFGDDEEEPIVNAAPVSAFTVQGQGLVEEQIQFTDNSSDQDGSIVSWQWNFGDGNSSTIQNPVHMYTEPETYEVTLIVTDDKSETDSSTVSIVIMEPEIQTGLMTRSISFNNATREYDLYVPTSYSEDTEVALVVYLHGAGENKEIAQATTDFIDVSESAGFILVFAEPGFELPGQGRYVWADGRGAFGGAVDGANNDVGFINALVDALSEEFQIDTARRYICGFSNGGSLAQRIAIQENERFAAIATVSAGLHETFETADPRRAIPMLLIHGTDDQIAPYEGGLPANNQLQFTQPLLSVPESVNFWVTNNQCDATPLETDLPDTDPEDNSSVTTFEYSGGTNGAEVKLYRVNSGGHTWPGVLNATARPETNFGVNNNDINAGQEIWNFFTQFELN